MRLEHIAGLTPGLQDDDDDDDDAVWTGAESSDTQNYSFFSERVTCCFM
jgi:hypothetical protein